MKTVFKSKTILFNLLIAMSALVPEASEWISANPEAFAALVGLANLALRYVTHQRVYLFLLLPLCMMNAACVSVNQPELSFKWQDDSGTEVGLTFTKVLKDAKNPISSK